MAIDLGHQFVTVEPDGTFNTFIQGLIRLMIEHPGGDSHSKVTEASIRGRPKIGADEKKGLYPKTRFFKGFPDQSGHQ